MPGRPDENEWSGVRAKFNLVRYLDFANISQRLRERFKIRDEVASSTELKFFHWTLAKIQNNVAEMVLHFLFVLFDVGEGAQQPLLFSGE